jgi:glucan phosphoethanolaminetransferase (alkaline phosphatase superfamily)
MATGFCFYGSLIFVPTNPAFQFTLSSITAGLFYGLSKSLSYRIALVALLIWYVVSTLIDVHNWFLFIIFLIYITGIAASVYVYMILIKRPLFNGIVRRLATISLLTGMFNALILLTISAFQATYGHIRLSTHIGAAIDNFQLGILIGLGIGIGIEVVEYLIKRKSFQHFIEGANASEQTANPDQKHVGAGPEKRVRGKQVGGRAG